MKLLTSLDASFTVPAKVVEQHAIDLIRHDLDQLRSDRTLHQYLADQMQRVSAGQADSRSQLRRRLADLDQQAAKLTDHLMAMDPATAKRMGLYDRAAALTDEREQVEQQLQALTDHLPGLPGAEHLKHNAESVYSELERVLEAGTIEEKPEVLAQFIHTMKADPDSSKVDSGKFGWMSLAAGYRPKMPMIAAAAKAQKMSQAVSPATAQKEIPVSCKVARTTPAAITAANLPELITNLLLISRNRPACRYKSFIQLSLLQK